MRFILTVLFSFILFNASNANANWPKDCGRLNKNVCHGPSHFGCIKNLKKCNIAGKSDICISKNKKCPISHSCSKCGNKNQKPCYFHKKCHICKKGFHVSVKNGKCMKSGEFSLEKSLTKINKNLTKYEKKCHKFLQKIEKNIDNKTLKSLEKNLKIHSVNKIISEMMYFEELKTTCIKESINGVSCAIIPWLKGYNEIALSVIKGHKLNGISKGAKSYAKKYIKNLTTAPECITIKNLESRAFCAAAKTIGDTIKKPISCTSHVIKDLFKHHHKKEDKKLEFKKSDAKKFIKKACYKTSKTTAIVAGDQLVSLLTAEIAETIELPKDINTMLKAIKTITNAKIKLEYGIDKAKEGKKLINNSKIKTTMKKYKSCKGLLKIIK